MKMISQIKPNTKLFKGEILGTATQKNCSTRFDNVNQNHNGSYFFRLEDDKVKYNFINNPLLQIVVSGSPPKPTLSVFKDQQEVMKMEEVMEESSLSLRCSTKIFCPSRPPSLTWTSSLNENITGQQYQSQSELVSDLNFTVSHRLHKVTFTCTATHQLQRNITTQRSRMIRVQYAPTNTSVRINPAGLVLEGRSVTLICSSDANPAVNYTWYRDPEELLNPVQTGPNLTLNNPDPTDRGLYYCRADNKHGSHNTSVLLDVQFAPKVNSSCSRNSVMSCVCEAHGNPCPTLEWRLSGHALTNSTETPISEEKLGSTGVKSVLTLRQSLSDTDVLQCFSSNVYGSASQQFQPISSTQETSLHFPSALLGAAVSASLMMILCIVKLYSERWVQTKPLLWIMTFSLFTPITACCHPHQQSEPQSLHYSSIDFSNTEAPSGEIRGMASLTSEYATIRHRPEEAADPENTTEPKQEEDMTAEITDTSSPASEDVIYGNIIKSKTNII
ncbi:sialic acid-binding Ig-like lectin 5 [Puntigrus tetrazona]|uniref:sialic acid-binding Ig-like lectin 5 n=1 Tax=Puntigrus tetrazona TaxID=1606681 RepID=UPI001C88EFC4|nr:sialic acid-binding Ig-like lectin 5 [Puntigrus tetrazona]